MEQSTWYVEIFGYRKEKQLGLLIFTKVARWIEREARGKIGIFEKGRSMFLPKIEDATDKEINDTIITIDNIVYS